MQKTPPDECQKEFFKSVFQIALHFRRPEKLIQFHRIVQSRIWLEMDFGNSPAPKHLGQTRAKERSNPLQRRKNLFHIAAPQTGYKSRRMTKIRRNPNFRHRHMNIQQFRITELRTGKDFRQSTTDFLSHPQLPGAWSVSRDSRRTLQVISGT